MNYKDLDSYKKIISLGWYETTGPIQKKQGTVRFSTQKHHFIYWHKDSLVSKVQISPSHNVNLFSIKAYDYDEAFKSILDSLSKSDQKNMSWFDQMKLNKFKVFEFLFYADENITSVKDLHSIMKRRGYLVKGKDY